MDTETVSIQVLPHITCNNTIPNLVSKLYGWITDYMEMKCLISK